MAVGKCAAIRPSRERCGLAVERSSLCPNHLALSTSKGWLCLGCGEREAWPNEHCYQCWMQRQDWYVPLGSSASGELRFALLQFKRRQLMYPIAKDVKLAILRMQHGCCPVCDKGEPDDIWVVDHDHKTGVVRGVIHGKCNTGLGLLGDSAESVRRAFEYLSQRLETEDAA